MQITRFIFVILAFVGVIQVFQPAFADEVRFGPWKYLYKTSPRDQRTYPLPATSRLKVIKDLTLTGEMPNDPFRFNTVYLTGNWGVVQGAVSQTSGRSAALKIGEGEEDFELEAVINAEGKGGWFLLFQHDQGHGFLLYNVTLITSGSPWFIAELRDDTGVKQTDQELTRYECRGIERFLVKVADGKLSAMIGEHQITEHLELANHQKGQILIGTYDTKYGPKPLKIHGLRIRYPRD